MGIYILEGALLGDSDRLNTPTSFSTRGPCLDSSRTATAVKGEWAWCPPNSVCSRNGDAAAPPYVPYVPYAVRQVYVDIVTSNACR